MVAPDGALAIAACRAGSVETETSHGDPAIDRVCRDAVKRWRFSPAKVAGQGRRACSEASFRIDFE